MVRIIEDILNLDSSLLIRYGNQKGAKRPYNPKKRGRPLYHPLLAFLDSGYVINQWNRSGDTGTGQGADDFFEVISKRYEKGSVIITSNKSFEQWGDIFLDTILASAIIDRIVHHCSVIEINGPSFRTKDLKKKRAMK